MNTQDENRDIVQSQYFDPFPEPRTIPSGWDTSGFFSTPAPDSAKDEEDSAES